jgi:hypothetical protein
MGAAREEKSLTGGIQQAAQNATRITRKHRVLFFAFCSSYQRKFICTDKN